MGDCHLICGGCSDCFNQVLMLQGLWGLPLEHRLEQIAATASCPACSDCPPGHPSLVPSWRTAGLCLQLSPSVDAYESYLLVVVPARLEPSTSSCWNGWNCGNYCCWWSSALAAFADSNAEAAAPLLDWHQCLYLIALKYQDRYVLL